MSSSFNLDDYHLDNLVEILSSSDDIQVVENIKSAVKESLANESVVSVLFDHYVATNSPRVLELLASVREPLDRVVFDKLCDLLKVTPTEALNLLFYLIHRQVSWMHKISQHSLFITLLKLGRNTKEVPVLISWLFVWCVLMPIVPLLTISSLSDIFQVFLRSSQILSKSSESEMVTKTLRVAVYAIFQRLYGMYPCNFLSFLRKNFADPAFSSANRKVFSDVIQPMLDHVKIHPLLITAPKEQELAKERWCHLEPQDVVSECAKLSFDPFEVGLTGFSRISSVQKDKSTSHFVTYHAENSTQCESKTCLTLSVINDQNLKPAIMEDMLTTKVVNNAEQDASAMFWSPSMVVGLMTPPGLTPSSSAADLSMRHRDGSRSNSALGQPLIRASGSFSSHFSSNEKNRHSSEASSLRRRHQSGLSSAFARVFGSKDSTSVPPSPAKPQSAVDQEDIFKFPPTAPARLDSCSAVPPKPGLAVRRNLSSISQTEEAVEAVEELNVVEPVIEEKSDLKPLSEALESLAIAKPENDKLDAEVTAILQQNTQLPSGSRFTEAQGGPVKFVMSDFYGKRPSLTSTTTSSPKSTDQQWDRVNRLSGVSDKTESSAPSVSPFDFHRKCSVMSLGGIPVLNQGEKPVNVVAQNSHTVPSDIINESRWTGPTIERPADLKPPTNGKETSSRDEPVHLGMLEEPNMTEIPRLTTSGSVANFMNRINRIRFHSHCVPGTIGADETHHQMDTSSDDSDASETEEQPSTVNLNASGLGMDEDVVNKKKISDTTAERKWSKRGLFRPRASSCPPSKMKRSATREKFRKISMEPRGLKPKVQRNSLQTAQDPLFLHGVVDVLNQMTASGPAEAGVIMSPSSSKIVANGGPGHLDVVDGATGIISAPITDASSHLSEISSILPNFGAQNKTGRLDSDSFAHLPVLMNFLALRSQIIGSKLETGGDAAAPSPHELFEEYINRARSIHDMSETDAESNEPNKCDAEAKGKLCLIYHQLQFERYKRQMQWQESRKLFGKFQQSVVRDEEIRALKDQIFRQDEEITNLVVALTDLRKQNVNQKEEHRSKEYSLNMQLQKFHKELEQLKRQSTLTARNLSEAHKEIEDLKIQLGSTKQNLLAVEARLLEANLKVSDRNQLKADADETRQRLLLCSELNLLLKESLDQTKRQLRLHESCEERMNILKESSTRELSDLKKQLRRQITKCGAANKKVEELELTAVKRQEQIGNLKIQLEMTRETHREQSTAAQAKYLALERVCHRQEGHILELYGHMERVAMLSRQRCRGGSSQEPIVIPDSLVGPKEILSLGHSGNQASSGANDWYLPFLFNDSIVAPPAGSDGAESGFHGGNFDRSEVVLPILDDDRLEETSQSVGMGSMSAHKFPNTLL